MKLKVLRWIALINGSISSVLLIPVILFTGAHFIGGINDGTYELTYDDVYGDLCLLSWVLYIISVVIAWFNSKIGGFFITFFALAQIILYHEAGEPGLTFIQFSLLPAGPLLLFYVYYNKWLLKNKGN